MSSDEQLIGRIRAAMRDEADELLPAANLLERLRAEPTPAASRGRWIAARVGRAGSVAVALASAVVIVVVVSVIGALGHGHTTPTAGSGLPAGIPSTARALVARMALFRRPQTPSDRLPAAVMMQMRSLEPRLNPALTRLATTIDAGRGPLAALRVYVILVTGADRTAGFAGVRLALVSGPPDVGVLALSGSVAPGGGAAFARPVAVPAVVLRQRSVRTSLWLGAVPDGVARVRWVIGRFPAGTGPDVTVSPRVKNNVAITTGAPATGNLTSATWYAASGRVISSFKAVVRIGRPAPAQMRLLSRSPREPIPLALSQHFAVFRNPTPPLATIAPLPAYARASVAANRQALNIDQARFVRYPGTPGFWVIPGRHGAAIGTFLGARGFGLDAVPLRGPVSVLDDQLITTVGSTPPRETVYGLVPDGNQTVTIKLTDGATKTVRVIDNAYAATLATRPKTLIAKNAYGQPVNVRVPG